MPTAVPLTSASPAARDEAPRRARAVPLAVLAPAAAVIALVPAGARGLWSGLDLLALSAAALASAAVAARWALLARSRRDRGDAAVAAGFGVAGVALGVGVVANGAAHAPAPAIAALLVLAALGGACALTFEALRSDDIALGLLAVAAAAFAAAVVGGRLAGSGAQLATTPGLAVTAVALVAALVTAVRRSGAQAVDDAVRAERLRLAREVHDGPAQDLAWMVHRARALAAAPCDGPQLEDLASTGEHAMTDLRRALHALQRPRGRSLGVALVEEAAGFVTADVVLEVDVLADAAVTPVQEHAVLCITREALSNALRHADADRVSVRLERRGPRLEVRIADDGDGFDPAEARRRRRGMGLSSMAWRARSAGGQLRLDSRPGDGTVVRVAL
jgi:signal transduction histidine kinase